MEQACAICGVGNRRHQSGPRECHVCKRMIETVELSPDSYMGQKFHTLPEYTLPGHSGPCGFPCMHPLVWWKGPGYEQHHFGPDCKHCKAAGLDPLAPR